MSNIATNIPLPIAPLASPDGRINEVWWRFFLDIFNRTGGGSGNEGGIDAIYPDIIAPLVSSDDGSLANAPDIYPQMQSGADSLGEQTFPSIQSESNQILEALFAPATADAPLPEMVLAPIIAQFQDVLFNTLGTTNGDITATNGDFSIATAGKGIRIKTAVNARAGQSVLAAGTVTVANTSVTANTRVLALTQIPGGTPGYVYKSAFVAGTSFTLTSTSAADTSTVFWFLVEIQ